MEPEQVQPHKTHNQEIKTDQTTTSPQQPLISASDFSKPKTSTKKYITLGILIFLVLAMGSGAAYIFMVYIPNKPENVFKKAVLDYATKSRNYTITGRLDQAGPNDPDFDYSVKTNTQNDSSAEVHMSTFLQQPSVFVKKVNGKLYVRFTGFEDFKKLATHYSNSGEKGIQEYIAEFTERANLSTNQDQWLEVGDYVLAQHGTDKSSDSQPSGLNGVTLRSIGSKENVGNKPTRKYEVTLTSDAFKQVITGIGKSANVHMPSSIFPKDGLTTADIKASVWINLKTKTIEQISYEGRPFRDATFSLKLVASDHNSIDAPKAEKLTSKLGFGIVSGKLFNKQFQQGDSETDRERIADLKGIKTALEIYKARTGHYPERYEMAVNQQAFIGNQMSGADFEVFKDPSGRFIGQSGSQYAYVPALGNDSQDCGKFSKPCEKYFIVTTLDDGQYQLNSD